MVRAPPPRHQTIQERKLGQKFRVDVTIDTDLREAGRTDDLDKTMSYAAIHEYEALAGVRRYLGGSSSFSGKTLTRVASKPTGTSRG